MVKASIRKIVLGGLLGSLTAMSSVARAAEPASVTVDQAPGVDLPPQIATDLRAVLDDALAGRAQPGVPIDITLEAGGVVVQVGALARRIAVARWDYPAMRTVALNVLDLLQPAPEVSEVAAANVPSDPAATVVSEVPARQPATEQGPAPGGSWTVQAGVAGARGAQSPDPWMVSTAIGAAWTHNDWLRLGLEVGWDHSIVRHVDAGGVLVTVNYDAVPVRLVLAAQNSTAMIGVRGGFAGYRVTAEEHFREVTPLVGPFLAARIPIVGRFRGLFVGGFDYFGRRTQLSRGGFDTSYSTPQVAPYLGIIVEAVLRP
jgi:hypothetical protein